MDEENENDEESTIDEAIKKIKEIYDDCSNDIKYELDF